MNAQPTEVCLVDLRERAQHLKPIPQGILESHLQDKIDQVAEFFPTRSRFTRNGAVLCKKNYPDLWCSQADTYAMASYTR